MDRHDPSSSFEKESVRLKKSKGPNTLPPLQDFGPRTHSAPEGVGRDHSGPISEEAAEAVQAALNKARTLQDKKKKLSSTEKNLFNSPFAQPMLKQIQDGKTSPSH